MPDAPSAEAHVTLREVTRENLHAVLLLKVAAEQERFVASNAFSIAQAHCFMIDRRYQGHGFGRSALELVLEHVCARPGTSALATSYIPGDGSPGPFYQRLGFVPEGKGADEEILMRREL